MALLVVFKKVPPEKVDRLRLWMAELEQSRDEVVKTFKQETVRHEQAYLLEHKDSPIFVYAIQVQDAEVGRKAFQESTLAIDLEHKQIMEELSLEPAEAELLYDVALG